MSPRSARRRSPNAARRALPAMAGFFCLLACSPGEAPRSKADEARLNVLWIVVDTLRADVLECYGGPARTPHICALAERGTLFERAYANSPWTYPSAASMFSSQPSSRWEVDDPIGALDTRPISEQPQNSHYRIPETEPLLISELAEDGYEIVGRIENRIAAQAGGLRGLEDLNEIPRQRLARPKVGDLLGDNDGADFQIQLTTRYLSHPATAEQPFFLVHWINDPHAPYEPSTDDLADLESAFGDLPHPLSHYTSLSHDGQEIPPEKKMQTLKTGSEREVELMKTLYRLEVESVDARIGSILASLADSALEDRTVVALTSDHGEAFREHGFFLHGLAFFEEQVHVPLILAGPGIPTRTRISDPVSLLDLVPTLRDLLQRPASGRDAGRSLSRYFDSATAENDETLYLDGGFRRISHRDALIEGDLKLITSRWNPPALYDLSLDPGEQHNLARERPEETRRLLAKLEAWRIDSAERRRSDRETSAEEDPSIEETERRLRTLGYID